MRLRRLFRFIGVAAVVMGLGACTTPAAHSCAPGYGPPVTVFTLFLGRAIPGREDLTGAEWSGFLDTVVTANLPNGYTVMDAQGGWMNPITHSTIKETTKLLLVALPDVPDSLAAINRISTAYQLRFNQQSVGITVTSACGAF